MSRSVFLAISLMVSFSAYAVNFNGGWLYDWVNKDDPSLSGSHQIFFIQKGSMVCGRWAGGTAVNGWEGFLYGKVSGEKLYAYECTDPYDPEESPHDGNCPNHEANPDIYKIKNGQLYYYRYSSRGKGTGRYSLYGVLKKDEESKKIAYDNTYKELINYCSQHSNISLPSSPPIVHGRHAQKLMNKASD